MSRRPKEVYTPEVALIEARINDMKTRIQMIGEKTRFAAGFYAGFVKGFMLGIVTSIVILTIIFLAM
ncbi:MAG: tetrahydromethanopterin S-methyltransferase subunit F [Candidatus Nezhaarchaeota archaeon]|nr:tetrahydromethanopterin S-methyltransferase subunit F [Candidatus Nezhaarchaeota archaeon]MCX8141478.1 tetrahydromethanopterin S-methyltransferase subunit F [Candidatus Nezhaarchaeota archaeon]MDW8049744.1 tetrahydromethanopterin S-methyltransferase subunit F [Nitrososphaerota archaeon]